MKKKVFRERNQVENVMQKIEEEVLEEIQIKGEKEE